MTIELVEETKKEKKDEWMTKLMYSVTFSFLLVTLCIVVVIVALYFFVIFVAQQLQVFIKEIPLYQATLMSGTGIALTYIIKKFK
jgi:predicted PurR-regulated permease PerM